MRGDVNEMSRMLEGYLAFARGDAGEQPRGDRHVVPCSRRSRRMRSAPGIKTAFSITGDPVALVRPRSFKRCLANLVCNAARYAAHIDDRRGAGRACPADHDRR